MRALEGIVYSTYSGSRFVLVGTPSGISLSREGGAHQSISTPGIGIETPGLTYAEPCFARELEWLLLDALDRLQQPDGESLYLRLSTKPIDQAPFAAARRATAGADVVRAAVVAGGFRLREARPAAEDRVLLATCGAMVPEALAAADALAERGGRRGDRARALEPRPSLPRVAAAPHRAAARRARARPSHLERLVLARRARASRSSPCRRRRATRSPGSAPRSGRAACRSASTASARRARSRRSTPSTASTPTSIVTAALVALEP